MFDLGGRRLIVKYSSLCDTWFAHSHLMLQQLHMRKKDHLLYQKSSTESQCFLTMCSHMVFINWNGVYHLKLLVMFITCNHFLGGQHKTFTATGAFPYQPHNTQLWNIFHMCPKTTNTKHVSLHTPPDMCPPTTALHLGQIETFFEKNLKKLKNFWENLRKFEKIWDNFPPLPIHKNVFRENLRKFEIIFFPPKFPILKMYPTDLPHLAPLIFFAKICKKNALLRKFENLR